jgi:hypothetical protein
VLVSVAAAYGNSHRDAHRAHLAYRSLDRIYLDRTSGDYRQTPRGRVGSHAWPFSQALAATIEVARLDGRHSAASREAAARLRKLDSRFRERSVYHAAPGGDVYWDDNEWVAQDLLDWDAFHGSRAARRKAAEIFGALTRAWDPDPQKVCPGGVQWTDAPWQRRPQHRLDGERGGCRSAPLSPDTAAVVSPLVATDDRLGRELPARLRRPLRRPHRG